MSITSKRAIGLNQKPGRVSSTSETKMEIDISEEGRNFWRQLLTQCICGLEEPDADRRFQMKVKLHNMYCTRPEDVVSPGKGTAMKFCGQAVQFGGCSGLSLNTKCKKFNCSYLVSTFIVN